MYAIVIRARIYRSEACGAANGIGLRSAPGGRARLGEEATRDNHESHRFLTDVLAAVDCTVLVLDAAMAGIFS